VLIKPIFKNELELLLEVAEAFGWLLAGFLGFGFDCVVEEGMVLIFCCIGSLGRYKPQQSVDIIKTDCCTFTGAGSGFGASHIHKGIPHLHSIMGAALWTVEFFIGDEASSLPKLSPEKESAAPEMLPADPALPAPPWLEDFLLKQL
jgi:hypothetical protein